MPLEPVTREQWERLEGEALDALECLTAVCSMLSEKSLPEFLGWPARVWVSRKARLLDALDRIDDARKEASHAP